MLQIVCLFKWYITLTQYNFAQCCKWRKLDIELENSQRQRDNCIYILVMRLPRLEIEMRFKTRQENLRNHKLPYTAINDNTTIVNSLLDPTHEIVLGDCRWLWRLVKCSVTSFSTAPGSMFGTRRIENLPMTLRGMTVLEPAPSNAPCIPAEHSVVWMNTATWM